MSKPAPSSIASRIRQARIQARLDPVQLRAALKGHGIEISKAGLHRLETTEPTNPNLKLVAAIADISRVSPTWLLFGKGPALNPEDAGAAIRSRVIDTIELMAGALDMTARQEKTLRNWLASVRAGKPKTKSRPQTMIPNTAIFVPSRRARDSACSRRSVNSARLGSPIKVSYIAKRRALRSASWRR